MTTEDLPTKHLTVTPIDLCVECPFQHKREELCDKPCCAGTKFWWHHLSQCLVNSARKGHYCSNPKGQGRCPVALKAAQAHQGRTYELKVMPAPPAPKPRTEGEVIIDGQGTTFPLAEKFWRAKPHPVENPTIFLAFGPLNEEATKWFVCDLLSGERKEVDMTQQNRTIDGAELFYPWLGWSTADAYYRQNACDGCMHPLGCARHTPVSGKAYPRQVVDPKLVRYLPTTAAQAKEKELTGDRWSIFEPVGGRTVQSKPYFARSEDAARAYSEKKGYSAPSTHQKRTVEPPKRQETAVLDASKLLTQEAKSAEKKKNKKG